MQAELQIIIRAARLLPVLVAVAIVGCGRDGTENHAVSGRIELNGGDVVRLAGSTLEVALATDPTVRAFGEIQPDGRFVLQSLQKGELQKGLPEGAYSARIIPTDDDAPTRKRVVEAVAPRYLKFETSGLTVQVPPTGEVAFRLAAK